MNQTILQKLMALLPTVKAGENAVQAGANEVIELAAVIKSAAQDAQMWTNEHETALQAAVTAATPPTPAA